jgi:UDPglucose 6-dehydrogenase
MEKIGIVGLGICGSALYEGFKDIASIKCYDKFKSGYDTLEEVCKASEFIFVTLPTPFDFNTGKIDLSIIDENIEQIVKYTDCTNKIVILKSTIVPGTTIAYQKKYPKTNFAFNPEFLRESTYIEDFKNPDRTVIGATNAQIALRLLGLYTKRFPNTKIFRTDPTTAEMVKYMANSMLATIVLFNNVMFDICKSLGVSYEETAKMVSEDRRFHSLKSYFEVTSVRGYGGKCFPKDLNALIGRSKELNVDVSFLEKVWEENLRIRTIRDWKEIPWATS